MRRFVRMGIEITRCADAFQADGGSSIPLTRSSSPPLLIENRLNPPLGGLALAASIMHDIAAAGLYGPPHSLPEECSSIGRAPVSKTGGCRFESCHSCQAEIRAKAAGRN